MRLFRKNRGKKKKAKPNKGREKVLSPVRLTFFHGVWKVQDHTESDFNMHTFFNRHRKRQRSGQSVRSTTKSLRALQVTGSSNILSWCVKMFRIIQRVFWICTHSFTATDYGTDQVNAGWVVVGLGHYEHFNYRTVRTLNRTIFTIIVQPSYVLTLSYVRPAIRTRRTLDRRKRTIGDVRLCHKTYD